MTWGARSRCRSAVARGLELIVFAALVAAVAFAWLGLESRGKKWHGKGHRWSSTGQSCRSGLEPVRVVPVPDVARPLEDDLGAYKFESDVKGCEYEMMTSEQIGTCLKERWVLALGSSNSMGINHGWVKLLLQDEQESPDYLLWGEDIDRPVDLGLDAQGKVQCIGEEKCWARHGKDEIASHFTGLHVLTVWHAKGALERLAANGVRDARPPPEIDFVLGIWGNACVKERKWAEKACAVVKARQEANGASSILDQLTNDMVDFLAYLTAEWPLVKEITVDQRYLPADYVASLTPKLEGRSELPVIRYVNMRRLSLASIPRWLVFNDAHWYGRGTLLIAMWQLNLLCPARAHASEQLLVTWPPCETKEGYRHRDDRFSICPNRVVVRDATTAGPLSTAHAAALEASLKDEVVVLEPRGALTAYRNVLATVCGLFVLASAAFTFKPRVVSSMMQRVGLLALLQCVQNRWRGVFDSLTTCRRDSRDEKVSSSVESISSSGGSNGGDGPESPTPDPRHELTLDGANSDDKASVKDTEDGPEPVLEPASTQVAVPRPGTGKKLRALGMARFLASVHIVLGHLWTKDADPVLNFVQAPFPAWDTHGFGFTWVPWFMMLSGFVLTYARLNSSKPDATEPWYQFTWKRVRSIYPLYLAGLLARAGQRAVLLEKPFSLGGPAETAASLLLVQAWIPTLTERVLQMHCWFLSCIVPYWAVHQVAARILRRASTTLLVLLVLLVAAAPLAAVSYPAQSIGQGDWTSGYKYKGTNWETLLVVTLKFHPAVYWPVYLVGIAAAILLDRVREHPPFIVRYGAVIGYVALYTTFALTAWQPLPTYKLSYRMGLLAPLQALLLMGLAVGTDPIARLFSLDVLQPLENLSYPQYVFQFIAFNLWEAWAGLGFWMVLGALSIVGYYFVQKPLKSSRQRASTQVWGLLNIWVVVGVVALASLAFRESSRAVVQVSLDDGLSDVDGSLPGGMVDRNLSEALAPTLLRTAPPGSALINPSLLWLPGRREMWAAVRLHRLRTELTFDREDVVWESAVLVGRIHATTLEPLEPFREFGDQLEDTSSWFPCTNLTYMVVPSNSTLSRTLTTGPEDPRLFAIGPDEGLVLTSNLANPAIFPEDECRLRRRMLVTAVPPSPEPLPMHELLREPNLRPSSEEKNWLAFEHDGKLKFVRSIVPFEVITVTQAPAGPTEGAAARFSLVLRESSTFDKALLRIAEGTGAKFHGGANAILYTRPEDGRELYLAAFHTKMDDTYRNFLFEFSLAADDETWTIGRVSKPLNLFAAAADRHRGVNAPMAFLSGLTATSDGVLLAYGSSNAEARVRLVPWAHLPQLW